ncbi:DUF1206 domain-containing protein [Allokutzneria sp. A3M-2-11 16]|uniref:DUF1206 domain-containing protein n=1 Tax=Allokutzneria sp. A3M-2-11 16 TaxID=2962043 RepID=UPI0020B65520|nr:DUF1206 domain-containing protein [Allokutzneria sp. A3M-2-11 16]MCP3799284.1 DUF1206 domain-containing protein [Allokutzneria sp. A3M-2-11 16]
MERAVEIGGRVGMACFGLVHLVVAWLAVQVALGDSPAEADQKGALATIAAQPLGVALLIALAAGLAAFAVWQLLSAFFGHRWISDQRKRTIKRSTSAARGVAGIVLAVIAVNFLIGAGQESGDQSQKTLTAELLALPGGPWIVAAIAAVVFGVGVAAVLKGVRRTFLEELDLTRLPAGTRTWTRRLGMTGYPAKGIAFAVVGILLALAGFTADPNRAGGLDQALRELAALPFGVFVLLAVALGLAAFGVYCFADARCRRP